MADTSFSRLSPEDQATITQVLDAYHAVNPRERQLIDKSKDFAIPRELFERLGDVYMRYPMQDEDGHWFLAHRVFVDPQFGPEHLMFKAVHVRPE